MIEEDSTFYEYDFNISQGDEASQEDIQGFS